jgi:hypothetical protein
MKTTEIGKVAKNAFGKYERLQKFPDWVYNKIYSYNNKHSRSNTKGYGGKTH